MKTRRHFVRLCAAFATVLALTPTAPAVAQAPTKIRVGVQPISDYVTAYVAKDAGIFAKHGLDAEVQNIALSTLVTAGLVSGNLDIATPSAVDFLQAVDGGLDLVAINAVAIMKPGAGAESGVVMRKGLTISGPSSYEGKRIGVLSMNGLLHLIFLDYLRQNGIPSSKVRFVELGMPSHLDGLRSESVDGVITADPMLSRIVKSDVGFTALSLPAVVAPNTVAAVVATTRSYAEKNPQTIQRFKAAWSEATAHVLANPVFTRQTIVKHFKLPEAVAATLRMPPNASATLAAEQLQWWIDAMRHQKLIAKPVDLSRAVLR